MKARKIAEPFSDEKRKNRSINSTQFRSAGFSLAEGIGVACFATNYSALAATPYPRSHANCGVAMRMRFHIFAPLSDWQ
jgi:hypothetical protein